MRLAQCPALIFFIVGFRQGPLEMLDDLQPDLYRQRDLLLGRG
jgi:hypothetical protein